ncbi:ATPase AAA [Desulfolithobacter dissulfuricans]|uniref:ATPase AAA n=1 Tax=Desulfolithobacter dissulfuricans TaxID=2795293 RepID=A0A915XKE5_9BACT|nr:IS21-like element helper ATPase IstB [Desulfolithobacter dissulfuricans]BCO08871.1 ATPase AAA [Desulfolithobacter dissulfuricans]BCO08966.1 ATPase AAA [Desulfolithobacter dissulfuricans]BCO09897.1 ATPase AAA [Desulfolithobacter dissulfuricans]
MHPMPELIPMLKQLRLSGIMDSLEIRNRQAIDEKMAYTDFLALLIQDEVARRTQRKFDMRIRRAGFRNQKTLEDFDFSFNPAINKAQVMDLATCRFMEEKACVLIVGPCGTGKSHIAQALGHCAIRLGRDVVFTTQTKLLGQLQAARATNTYDRRLNTLAKVDLLIIDDFGLKPLRTPQDEDIHDLIGERYERRSTIITSNLDLSEWRDAFPNKLLGAATIDRIRHGAYCVVLDGKSYRTTKPLPKPQKKEVEKTEKSSKN